MSARHSESTASRVASPPARVSAIDTAMLQKLSPGATTHSVGSALGAAGAGAGGGTVVVVGGAVVVVVGAVVVVVVVGAVVVVVVVGAVVVVVVVGAVVVVVGAVVVVVVGASVVGAAGVTVSANTEAEAGGDDDAGCAPVSTGVPSLHPATALASRPTPTNHRSARVTART